MRRKIGLLMLVAAMLMRGHIAEAQQPKKVPRLAYIDTAGSPSAPEEAFKWLDSGLRELGYIDGQNIVIERRYTEGRLDRIPALVK